MKNSFATKCLLRNIFLLQCALGEVLMLRSNQSKTWSFWDMSISLQRPLWDKPCLPRAYFETCPLSYNNHYETWPFWDMTFFLQQPLWDMTILRHDIFPTATIMRPDHFETWHFSYSNHYERWPFRDMVFCYYTIWSEKKIFPLLVCPTISAMVVKIQNNQMTFRLWENSSCQNLW